MVENCKNCGANDFVDGICTYCQKVPKKKLSADIIQTPYSFLLPLLTVLLFPANFWICEYFYPDDIEKWWDLRTNLCAVNFAMALACCRLDKTIWFKF